MVIQSLSVIWPRSAQHQSRYVCGHATRSPKRTALRFVWFGFANSRSDTSDHVSRSHILLCLPASFSNLPFQSSLLPGL